MVCVSGHLLLGRFHIPFISAIHLFYLCSRELEPFTVDFTPSVTWHVQTSKRSRSYSRLWAISSIFVCVGFQRFKHRTSDCEADLRTTSQPHQKSFFFFFNFHVHVLHKLFLLPYWPYTCGLQRHLLHSHTLDRLAVLEYYFRRSP